MLTFVGCALARRISLGPGPGATAVPRAARSLEIAPGSGGRPGVGRGLGCAEEPHGGAKIDAEQRRHLNERDLATQEERQAEHREARRHAGQLRGRGLLGHGPGRWRRDERLRVARREQTEVREALDHDRRLDAVVVGEVIDAPQIRLRCGLDAERAQRSTEVGLGHQERAREEVGAQFGELEIVEVDEVGRRVGEDASASLRARVRASRPIVQAKAIRVRIDISDEVAILVRDHEAPGGGTGRGEREQRRPGPGVEQKRAGGPVAFIIPLDYLDPPVVEELGEVLDRLVVELEGTALRGGELRRLRDQALGPVALEDRQVRRDLAEHLALDSLFHVREAQAEMAEALQAGPLAERDLASGEERVGQFDREPVPFVRQGLELMLVLAVDLAFVHDSTPRRQQAAPGMHEIPHSRGHDR